VRRRVVGLGVWIELAPERDYFIIRAEIANAGPFGVTRVYAGHGPLLSGEQSRTAESVYVPTRGARSREEFSPTSYGLPTYAWGWMDYSGRRGGIGMG
jgi:hypothetical protein